MKRNVAAQAVGCQMTTILDGSNFTGAVTVFLTGDNGTQTIGSVGSGICTHKGLGYHSYAPSQAETNFEHIAFTFSATGAVTSTVQVYTDFPQTGDAFARLGAPVGASVSADIAGVQADTDNIQTRLPAALVGGKMDSSVGAYAAGQAPLQPTVAGRTLDVSLTGEAGLDWANIGAPTTAVALSGTTISPSQVVASVTGAVGSVTGNVGGNVNGSVGSIASGGISSASFALGAINAAAIAADAIGASELAADAVNEIADQVWDELLSGHVIAGSAGAALAGAGSAGDPWTTLLPGAYGAGSAGNIVGNRLDVAVGTRLAPTVAGRTLDVTTTGGAGIDWSNVEAPTTAVALTNTTISPAQAVASVAGSVGSVAGNVSGNVTGSVGSVAANGITAASLDPTAGAEIADAVWDEAISGHLAAGSTGAALNAAGSSGDPWATPVPGAYGAGTAGNILGTNLNATVSSRATQTSVDAVKADTAAIKLKTDNLPPDPADESNTQARFTTLDTSIATLTGFVDTEVAAIKAKTDNLPPDPADNSDILAAIAARPSATVIADTLLNRDMAAVSDTNPRSPLNALRRLRNKNDAAVTPGQIAIYKENDTTIAYVATLTVDAAAAPVTVFDPTT